MAEIRLKGQTIDISRNGGQQIDYDTCPKPNLLSPNRERMIGSCSGVIGDIDMEQTLKLTQLMRNINIMSMQELGLLWAKPFKAYPFSHSSHIYLITKLSTLCHNSHQGMHFPTIPIKK